MLELMIIRLLVTCSVSSISDIKWMETCQQQSIL